MPTKLTFSSYNYNSKYYCHSIIFKNCFHVLIYTDFMLADLTNKIIFFLILSKFIPKVIIIQLMVAILPNMRNS